MNKKIVKTCLGAAYMLLLNLNIYIFEKNPIELIKGCPYGMNEQQMILWNMIFAPIWFFAFYLWDNELSFGLTSVLRYKSWSCWYRKTQMTLIEFITVSYIAFAIGFSLLFYASEVILAFIMIYIHAIFLMEIGLTLTMVVGKILPVSIGIVIFETVASKLIVRLNIKPIYILSSWGMSGFIEDSYSNGGFNQYVIITIEVVVILLLIYFGIKHYACSKLKVR